MPDRYTYAEQARHYREAARDRGCTCPDLMAPHTHLLDCPLYEASSAVVVVPSPDGDAIDPASADGARESKPGEAGLLSSPGAGDYLEHLDQEHDADEGRPWL